MLSRKNSLFVLAVIIILTSVCLAQQPESKPVIKPAADKQQKMPYIAKVNAENVYVRAGNGTLYYKCGKLDKGQEITVVGSEYGWVKILPPEGSFSWVSKDFVQLEQGNEKFGAVKGDAVRIWAGSNDIGPLSSIGYQTKLNKGDIVQLIGEEESGYYKIAPPSGAYLWVSDQFIKYFRPVTKSQPQPNIEEAIEKQTAETAAKTVVDPTSETTTDPATQSVTPAVDNTQSPAPAERKPASEFARLDQCRELGKLIEDQRKKLTGTQDYTKVKAALAEIMKDEQAGKAKIYAEYLANLIERFELAVIAKDALIKQDYELTDATKKIKEKLAAELENLPLDSQFTVTGTIKPSQIFTADSGMQRYLVVDDTGKVICYAIPADNIAANNLKSSINKKVILAGEVIKNPHSAITLVRFTDIKDFELPKKMD